MFSLSNITDKRLVSWSVVVFEELSPHFLFQQVRLCCKHRESEKKREYFCCSWKQLWKWLSKCRAAGSNIQLSGKNTMLTSCCIVAELRNQLTFSHTTFRVLQLASVYWMRETFSSYLTQTQNDQKFSLTFTFVPTFFSYFICRYWDNFLLT